MRFDPTAAIHPVGVRAPAVGVVLPVAGAVLGSGGRGRGWAGSSGGVTRRWMVGGGWLWMIWPWGPVARRVPSGRSSIFHPQRWMQMSWWYWQSEHAVVDAGGAAVFFVFDVVDVGDGGGAVAAGGPGAVLVAGDDGVADGGGDVVGVADVEGDALAVELGAEQGAAQGGGDAAGAGDEVDREPGQPVQELLLVLRGQRPGPGGGAGSPGPPAALAAVCWRGRSVTRVIIWVMTFQSGVPVTMGTMRASQAAASASLPSQVAVLAGPGPQPGLLDGGGAGHRRAGLTGGC